MTKTDVYENVKNRIVAALDKGVVAWRRPWATMGGGAPRSIDGRPYRGINIFLLLLESLDRNYSDPRWGTFNALYKAAVKQAKREGREIVEEIVPTKSGRTKTVYYEIIDGERVWFKGGVRKGEKGTKVLLWKPVPKKGKKANGEDETGTYLLGIEYTVFNAQQADGIPALGTLKLNTEIEREAAAEAIIDGYADGPAIERELVSNRAFYHVGEDKVTMPMIEQFRSVDSYYSTFFHELVHSTGHESRIGRDLGHPKGSPQYAKEELVAEFGGAMLTGLVGLQNDYQIEQSAAYIADWKQAIEENPKLVVQAAAAAQKAADRILGVTYEKELPGREEGAQEAAAPMAVAA